MLGLSRRAVSDRQMWRLQALLALQSRGQAGLENPADDQGSIHRIRSFAGGEHFFDLSNQAGGIGDVGSWGEKKLSRLNAPHPLDSGRKIEVFDCSIQHQQRRAEAVVALNEVGSRL